MKIFATFVYMYIGLAELLAVISSAEARVGSPASTPRRKRVWSPFVDVIRKWRSLGPGEEDGGESTPSSVGDWSVIFPAEKTAAEITSEQLSSAPTAQVENDAETPEKNQAHEECDDDSDCASGMCHRANPRDYKTLICCDDRGFVTFSSTSPGARDVHVCKGRPAGSVCERVADWRLPKDGAGAIADEVCDSGVCVDGRCAEGKPSSAPIVPGYTAHNTGGCIARNELGVFSSANGQNTLQDCADRCNNDDICVSFEYSKDGYKCQLSSSCDHFDLTVKKETDPFYWYLKDSDLPSASGLNVVNDTATVEDEAETPDAPGVAEKAQADEECDDDSDCASGMCHRANPRDYKTLICCDNRGFVSFSSTSPGARDVHVCKGRPSGSVCERVADWRLPKEGAGAIADEVCDSGVCVDGRCAEGKVDANERCDTDSDCQNGNCAAIGWGSNDQICCPDGISVVLDGKEVCSPIPDGERCGNQMGKSADKACASALCLAGTCSSTRAGHHERCSRDSDCIDGLDCTFGTVCLKPLDQSGPWDALVEEAKKCGKRGSSCTSLKECCSNSCWEGKCS